MSVVVSVLTVTEVLGVFGLCTHTWSDTTVESEGRRLKFQNLLALKSHSPARTRCSERLTKIGKRREREKEERAFGIAAAALPMSYYFGIVKYKKRKN